MALSLPLLAPESTWDMLASFKVAAADTAYELNHHKHDAGDSLENLKRELVAVGTLSPSPPVGKLSAAAGRTQHSSPTAASLCPLSSIEGRLPWMAQYLIAEDNCEGKKHPGKIACKSDRKKSQAAPKFDVGRVWPPIKPPLPQCAHLPTGTAHTSPSTGP